MRASWARSDRAAPAVAAISAAATYFTLVAWSALAVDSAAYLVPLFFLVFAVAVGGVALRAVGLSWWLVPAVQTLGVLVALHTRWAGAQAVGGWLPTGASVRVAAETVVESVNAAGAWAAPVPADVTSFAPLMILAGAAVALVADALACTLRRVPLAGLVLLAAFTAPVSITGGASWLTFAFAAGSFVLLLAADQAARLSAWGTAVAGRQRGSGPQRDSQSSGDPRNTLAVDNQPHQIHLGTLMPTATRLGLAALGLAVLAPAFLPSTDGLIGGNGDGSGGGSGDGVSLTNPLVDLKRDLVRGEDRVLVVARTEQPDPSYLRLTVLDRFDGGAWRPSDRPLTAEQRVSRATALPPPPGLEATASTREYSWDLSVADGFNTSWLPLPYPPVQIDIPGEWRYDAATLDVVSAEEDGSAAGLQYAVSALDVSPTARELVDAVPAPRALQTDNTAMPSDVQWVRELAVAVTDGAQSSFEKAVRLQDWFQRDGGFTYSLDRASGNGLDDLRFFLGTSSGSRTGYCEQFAASMALMARALNIPARVAVGFLSPDRAGPETWAYSSHDLHAWPELYFSGVGWVRFEPTPQNGRGTTLPAYTVGEVPRPDLAPTPSVSGSLPDDLPSRAPQSEGNRGGTTSSTSSTPWLIAGLAVVVLLSLLTTPRMARRSLRRRRWGPADPGPRVERAWAEVRATALDLGLGWSDTTTLRRRARALAPALGGSAPGVRALESLVVMLERVRFSLEDVTGEEAERAVEAAAVVCAALEAHARPRARRRATWWPPSLLRGMRGLRMGTGPRRGSAGLGSITPERQEREQDRVSV